MISYEEFLEEQEALHDAYLSSPQYEEDKRKDEEYEDFLASYKHVPVDQCAVDAAEYYKRASIKKRKELEGEDTRDPHKVAASLIKEYAASHVIPLDVAQRDLASFLGGRTPSEKLWGEFTRMYRLAYIGNDTINPFFNEYEDHYKESCLKNTEEIYQKMLKRERDLQEQVFGGVRIDGVRNALRVWAAMTVLRFKQKLKARSEGNDKYAHTWFTSTHETLTATMLEGAIHKPMCKHTVGAAIKLLVKAGLVRVVFKGYKPDGGYAVPSMYDISSERSELLCGFFGTYGEFPEKDQGQWATVEPIPFIEDYYDKASKMLEEKLNELKAKKLASQPKVETTLLAVPTYEISLEILSLPLTSKQQYNTIILGNYTEKIINCFESSTVTDFWHPKTNSPPGLVA